MVTRIAQFFDPELNFNRAIASVDSLANKQTTGKLHRAGLFVGVRAKSAFYAAPLETGVAIKNAIFSAGNAFGVMGRVIIKSVNYILPSEYLRNVEGKLGTFSDLKATVYKTVKYALGAFSTFFLGALSPAVNIKIHTRYGLYVPTTTTVTIVPTRANSSSSQQQSSATERKPSILDENFGNGATASSGNPSVVNTTTAVGAKVADATQNLAGAAGSQLPQTTQTAAAVQQREVDEDGDDGDIDDDGSNSGSSVQEDEFSDSGYVEEGSDGKGIVLQPTTQDRSLGDVDVVFIPSLVTVPAPKQQEEAEVVAVKPEVVAAVSGVLPGQELRAGADADAQVVATVTANAEQSQRSTQPTTPEKPRTLPPQYQSVSGSPYGSAVFGGVQPYGMQPFQTISPYNSPSNSGYRTYPSAQQWNNQTGGFVSSQQPWNGQTGGFIPSSQAFPTSNLSPSRPLVGSSFVQQGTSPARVVTAQGSQSSLTSPAMRTLFPSGVPANTMVQSSGVVQSKVINPYASTGSIQEEKK